MAAPGHTSSVSLPSALFTFSQGCIRPYHPSDAPALAVHANNHNISRWMTNRFPHPYGLEDAEEWINVCINSSPMCNYAITDAKNSVIGGIGLAPNSPLEVHALAMEIGYWLGEDRWGRGIASEVLAMFTDWAFRVARQDLQRLAAAVFEGNVASGRVLLKAGYVFEGVHRKAGFKEGKVLDERVYAMTRDDWQKLRG